jgi:hypothetical protein
MRGFQGGREQAEMDLTERLDIVLQDRRRRRRSMTSVRKGSRRSGPSETND